MCLDLDWHEPERATAPEPLLALVRFGRVIQVSDFARDAAYRARIGAGAGRKSASP